MQTIQVKTDGKPEYRLGLVQIISDYKDILEKRLGVQFTEFQAFEIKHDNAKIVETELEEVEWANMRIRFK